MGLNVENTRPDIVGIDPGKRGAMAFYCRRAGKLQDYQLLPHNSEGKVDVIRLASWIISRGGLGVRVYVEQQSASRTARGFNVKSTCTTFENLGRILATLDYCELNYQMVDPKKWMGHLLKDMDKDLGKQRAINFVQENFSDVDLIANKVRGAKGQGRVPHDGLADACCITYYGFLKETGAV